MSLLQHFIDDSASRNADAEAFRVRNDSLSYGTLVEQANRVANVLLDDWSSTDGSRRDSHVETD